MTSALFRPVARPSGFLLPLCAAALLAGCTSTYSSPVQVTRFLGDDPSVLGAGPIALRAAPGQDPNSLEYSAYQTAVADALGEIGYVVTGGDATQVAEVRVDRFVDIPGRGRSPVSVGVGGSTGSYGSGLGLGIGLDLSGPPPERIDTELHVIIRPTAGEEALWEGRSRFTATVNSDDADIRASAERLADALFEGFPGTDGETIEVR